jgi:DNA invertase Pin-like site-specific DNA recombinase
MKHFAFYGRVSTEDQQDPDASRGWQLARARSLIEPDGGHVVIEFFDEGQSRSLPWSRRPQASALLAALRDPTRGFEAVVIGEPARAFYGNQFGLTFPVLEHFGVDLWVPEVGGRVDPGSEAHDLVMSLYGGMSKGERQRIKIRVRAAMADQAQREGRFLGGRPPYGYQLVDAGPHPNPAKAGAGQRAHRLAPDPATAPIVRRIFAEYLAGAGLYAIAEGLTRDGVPSPSAHDRSRNRHREGRAWAKSAVRAILLNPRYTGREVWNRQPRHEVLVDVDDVAAGYDTVQRWNDPSEWAWSAEETHEALVSAEDYARAQELARAGRNRPAARKAHRAPHPYMLRGLLTCGLCGRRMSGHHIRNETRYRCRYPTEYALANEVDHPRTVLVREDWIVTALDEWLLGLFDRDRIEETVARLVASADTNEADAAAIDAARRQLADCDARLAKYRAALERGTDPTVVAGWVAEVQGQRLAAERQLATATPSAPLSAHDVARMIEESR